MSKVPVTTYPRPGIPAEFAAWLRATRTTDPDLHRRALHALRGAGWRTGEIGDAAGYSRQRAHQLLNKPVSALPRPDVPTPTPKPSGPSRVAQPPRPTLTARQAAELRRLHALARRLRGGMAADDPRRLASVRLSALLAEHHDGGKGVTLPALAAALGVGQSAVYARLARHGYKATASTARHLQPYQGAPRAS